MNPKCMRGLCILIIVKVLLTAFLFLVFFFIFNVYRDQGDIANKRDILSLHQHAMRICIVIVFYVVLSSSVLLVY